MNHTNKDLEEFFVDMDEEFKTLENVIKSTFDAIDICEKIHWMKYYVWFGLIDE